VVFKDIPRENPLQHIIRIILDIMRKMVDPLSLVSRLRFDYRNAGCAERIKHE